MDCYSERSKSKLDSCADWRRLGIGIPWSNSAPFAVSWELRCGPDNRFRVFYDVDSELREVQVLAVGVKDRNRLLIGGEEYR